MTAIATPEVRQRAIEAYRSGQGTQNDIARMFGVTPRTFRQWWKAFRQEGRTAPLPRGHQTPAFTGKNRSALDRYMEKRSDATLAEIQEAFADHVQCSDVAIHNTLKALGWAYKKSGYVRMSETDRT
jgi:transposase-like protein